MEKSVLEFEQQKKRIEENLEYVKQNLESLKDPILIELLGTAKSGKTTLLNHLMRLFERNGIPIETRQETAEYNPIKNKDLEEYNIWMFMELMKNLSEDMSDKTPRIVIYDRGMLDRLPWIDFSVNDGSIPVKDSMLLKQLYQSEFLQRYNPLAYGLVTSPEISVARKGKEGRLVNRKNVQLFNEYLEKEHDSIEKSSEKYTIMQTDPYQGDIQRFIMDMTEVITRDIREKIKEIEFGSVGGEAPGSIER